MPHRPGASDGRRDPRNHRKSASTNSQTQSISVDSVLGFTSRIPSGQPRGPPNPLPSTPSNHSTIASSASSNSAISSSVPPTSNAPAADLRAKRIKPPPTAKLPVLQARLNQRVPQRSTKTTEKLVLLPDGADSPLATVSPDDVLADPVLTSHRPLRDDELDELKKGGAIYGRSYAEWLPKKDRSDGNVARLTAYCGAHGYNVNAAAKFVRETHGAKAKLYDDCLYVIYALPLLPGSDGYRVRSRPILKTPGSSRTVIDEEIERGEQRVDHSAFLGFQGDGGPADAILPHAASHDVDHNAPPLPPRPERLYTTDDNEDEPNISTLSRLPPSTNLFAEMFIFSYGVVVFWNFSEQQERLILADLELADHDDVMSETSGSSGSGSGSVPGPVSTSASAYGYGSTMPSAAAQAAAAPAGDAEFDEDALVQQPLDQDEFETEEFHFAYSADVSRPRIFNDMITLLPGSDHMIKLTISHAIAQSTKLCYFEERMTQTLSAAQNIPKQLAKTGQLIMKREQIMSIMGQLFKSRVELNLSSNILDTPKFFWDYEPTLHPLYSAIREYLELENRIKVLNERCQVFLDLTEILSDSIADSNMSTITWIIIVLIIVSILVTVTEVLIRVSILRKNQDSSIPALDVALRLGGHIGTAGLGLGFAAASSHGSSTSNDNTNTSQTQTTLSSPSPTDSLATLLALDLARLNVSVEDLRRWSQMWTPDQRGAVCGSGVVGTTWTEL
ncbi:Sporulation protein RMD8 [Ceratocystis fimbriata CBS 114723]|uniref:Sporulation protein RMD8 n=1 Tax=Ceratocystis fimbriata CBS 114723 TaxID=1035309 RepID=A0A2C5WYT7_9PEZI|nr:Sporulation protein RMD8 [Ceratocystis fimbriata CBS 114723]